MCYAVSLSPGSCSWAGVALRGIVGSAGLTPGLCTLKNPQLVPLLDRRANPLAQYGSNDAGGSRPAGGHSNLLQVPKGDSLDGRALGGLAMPFPFEPNGLLLDGSELRLGLLRHRTHRTPENIDALKTALYELCRSPGHDIRHVSLSQHPADRPEMNQSRARMLAERDPMEREFARPPETVCEVEDRSVIGEREPAVKFLLLIVRENGSPTAALWWVRLTHLLPPPVPVGTVALASLQRRRKPARCARTLSRRFGLLPIAALIVAATSSLTARNG